MIRLKPDPVTKQIVTVTKSRKPGRPRVHASPAQRTAAYRKRKEARSGDVSGYLAGTLGMGA